MNVVAYGTYFLMKVAAGTYSPMQVSQKKLYFYVYY